jgi:hypothetical protein
MKPTSSRVAGVNPLSSCSNTADGPESPNCSAGSASSGAGSFPVTDPASPRTARAPWLQTPPASRRRPDCSVHDQTSVPTARGDHSCVRRGRPRPLVTAQITPYRRRHRLPPVLPQRRLQATCSKWCLRPTQAFQIASSTTWRNKLGATSSTSLPATPRPRRHCRDDQRS